MAETRRSALWFLGAMLALPVIQFVFSTDMLTFLYLVLHSSAPLNLSSWTFLWGLLVAGFAVTALLCELSVARWGAPAGLWFVAIGYTFVQLKGFAWAVLPYAGQSGGPFQLALDNWFSGSAFPSAQMYWVAVVGYVVAAAFGCWLGARIIGRRAAAAAAGQSSDTHA
jgi:hypothetical protein